MVHEELSRVLIVGSAFCCRETCRDEPFSAERPFSTEADVETEHGGASSVTGCKAIIGTRRGRSTHTQHMKTSVRFQAVGVAMASSSVLDHSERDFVLCLLLRRHFESRIVTNAGG